MCRAGHVILLCMHLHKGKETRRLQVDVNVHVCVCVCVYVHVRVWHSYIHTVYPVLPHAPLLPLAVDALPVVTCRRRQPRDIMQIRHHFKIRLYTPCKLGLYPPIYISCLTEELSNIVHRVTCDITSSSSPACKLQIFMHMHSQIIARKETPKLLKMERGLLIWKITSEVMLSSDEVPGER